MKIYAGPCLLNDNKAEIEDCYKTAGRLTEIDNDIRFRCKLWGGGTTPEKYITGIGFDGIEIIDNITGKLKTGIEIKDGSLLEDYRNELGNINYIWIAARSAQNYELLGCVYGYLDNSNCNEVLIKRHPGMTVDEIIGIHDICEKIYGYKPIIIERGINTFCRTEEQRWMPDFQGMLKILRERPDIELCFDVSHACGKASHILPMTKAAVSLGVKNFMFEVMNSPALSQTDKKQILNIEEFRQVYNYIKANVLE